MKAAKALKEKGDTPEELLRSIKENEKVVAEAQRVVDAWKAIVGEKTRREEAAKAEAERIATEKAEAERKAAEERERAEKEEEARVEAERKAEEERIAKQKSEEKTAEAESDKEEAEKRMDDEEPKPVGSGVFGNIYNQFKGKVKEAFDFLMKHKGGDLLGVFHRKDVGDIDLVWGDHGGGLAHIIRRHIIEQNDFKNVDEIQKVIEDVIRNGLIVRENKDKINIEYNGYRVSIKKTIRDSKGSVVENKNWIVTAFDKSKPKHEKRNPSSSETLTTPSANQKADGVTLPSNEDSIDKGSEKPEKKQEKQSVFDKAKEIADKEEKKRKAEADKPKQKPLTEAERKDAEEVAGALGYRVEWVDTMAENGTIDADKKVIRIAKDAENPLVQVLGHEVAHGVRRMIGGKFRTLQKAAMEVVGEKEWNERIEKKRKLNAYAEGKLAEEVTCDIVGEALNDKDALKRLAESLRGEKGILARLRDAVARMVEYFKNRGDKEGVRRMKAADKLLAEFESALKEGENERRLSPDTPIRLVNADADHGFKNYEEARAWAKENIARTYGNDETGGKGEIRISNTAIGKFLSEKAVGKSESKDVHLAVLRVLPDVIRESVDAEQHADYRKGADGKRGGNGVNPDVTMHILYGAVTIDGKTYRVKTTLKENVRTKEPTKAYTYEATKIELLAGPNENVTMTFSRDSNNSITAAKLLKGVKKSYSNEEIFANEGIDRSVREKGELTDAEVAEKERDIDHSVRSSKEMAEERLEIERKAKSDGTWLKAPNGKRTNLNERQWVDVRTKNFKEWFGDWENDPENASKIVDENGEPLMVFHYTPEDFTVFGEGKEIGASTFYNASDANYAATAAVGDWFTSKSDLPDYMGKPMRVFLNIKEPSDGRSLEVLADEVGYEISSKDYEAFDEDRDNTAPIIEAGKNYQEKLRDRGYDGIFIADEEFGGTSYITFAPNQIKSAVENDGSYSPKENDIRRSVREKKEDEKTELTAEERELRDNLVERMRKGGLDVVTDSEEMQRVIDTENERTRNMFVGEKGATEADKAEEVSTRLDNLSVARRMEEAKKDAKTIKMATGWERGSDGKWRYETGDAKIKDTIELDGKTFKRYEEDMLWTSGKFGDVVDAPELFKAYPELRDVRIETDAVLNDMPSNGEYNPRTNTITIHSDDLKYQNSILNHEIQHAIQHIEGFETGGSAENVRERIQQVIDNSSDEVGYARERLREWADLNAMAAMLDVAYRKFVGSGNEWERAKAVEIYWDAINTIEDNDKAELAINYPHDKTPREVAESGYLVDDVIRELNRLADETRKEIPDGDIDTMRKVDRLVGALKDKTDFELYNRLAGEVEARNTEKRIGMTEEERRASLASETEDVAREDQILLGVDNADGEMNTGSVREHRVYHGSGADFDAFDHSHMGEGEGAQAYGWGTYVTEVEGIGRTYAEQNATTHNDALRALQHDVDAISDQLNRHRDDLKYDEEQLKRANEWRAEAELDYELFKDEAEELKEKYGEASPEYRNHLFNDIYTDEMKRAQSSVKSMEESIQYRKEKIAELEKALKDKQAEIDELPKEFPRHLYTVEIPDDNGSNYLDWNGHPAESLLKDVGSFLESNGFERVQDSPARYEKGESTVVLNPNATGADLYAELQKALGSDKKASQALAESGCIGIKYPADNMRGGREDGAKNYVIFNENDAKITDHTRFLRTASGEVYGLVKDGRIYLDPKVATSETAVHEYTHLWGDMLRRKDSEQWSHTVKELKNSVLWEEVKELYPELKTDDEIADEVLSTFSGRRGAERLREEARRVAEGEGGVFTKAKAIETLERVKETIARFWEGVARMFGINRYRSAEELADMAMRDLINGVKPTSRTFTFDNFYKDTKAVFEGTERPKGKPDYTSYSGSEYWYGEDNGGKYVVRGSDHWSGEFKVKDGERTNVGRNHYSEITEDGMLPIGAQGSLKFGWEKGLSKPVGSGISAAIDRRGSGDSNNIASCYWYIDNAKEKDNKGFTYGKAYLSEFEDKERRRDIPGDDWRDIQGLEGGTRAMAVKKANDRFNEELELQVKGELEEGHVYKLGMPSEILLSTGVPNLPIELSAKQLSKKAADRGHRFDVKDIANLPQAIQAPIAVFEYGNKDKSQNLIVEIERDGKKFVVGIHFNQNRRGIVVNDIRGLFNKDSHEWLNWISQGKLLYADKEKIQALMDKQRTNLAEVNYLNLDDVAKKVKDFENPKLFDGKISEVDKKGSDSIDRSVRENPKNEDKPRFSRKPGESIFDYASRVSEDVDRSVRERVSARYEYEKKVKSKGFQTKEALQNSMLGLHEFMYAIDHASGNKRYIEDIPDFENPILGENRLSSVNKEESHSRLDAAHSPTPTKGVRKPYLRSYTMIYCLLPTYSFLECIRLLTVLWRSGYSIWRLSFKQMKQNFSSEIFLWRESQRHKNPNLGDADCESYADGDAEGIETTMELLCTDYYGQDNTDVLRRFLQPVQQPRKGMEYHSFQGFRCTS